MVDTGIRRRIVNVLILVVLVVLFALAAEDALLRSPMTLRWDKTDPHYTTTTHP